MATFNNKRNISTHSKFSFLKVYGGGGGGGGGDLQLSLSNFIVYLIAFFLYIFYFLVGSC